MSAESSSSLVTRSSARWPLLAGAALSAGLAVQALRLHLANRRQLLAPSEPVASTTTPSAASSPRPAATSSEAPAEAVVANGRVEETPKQPSERQFGLRTLLAALQASDRVNAESIDGPFQLNPGEEVPVICFQFKMSHFVCKAYLAHGADEGSQHLKLQTIFEDNRNSLLAEQRYFVANEWNTTKPYTRLKCGSSDRGRSNVFTLEYDLLCPTAMPHSHGLQLLLSSLRMWYTSMVACVMHIVVPRDIPFATHEMIVGNTLATAVCEEDVGLQTEACPICLECFQVGEKVRRLPCMHIFHVVGADTESAQGRHCNIDRHLVLDKQCPVCKTPIDIMERMERERAAQSGEDSALRGLQEGGNEQVQAATGASAAQSDASQTALVARAAELSSAMLPRPNVSDSTVAPDDSAPRASSARAGHREELASEAASLGHAVSRDAQALDSLRSQVRLPEQAAELERVVRSLQSRWLQIQDVVAGMQEMLRYIEDSQSALSAARSDERSEGADPPAQADQTPQEDMPHTQQTPHSPGTQQAPQPPETQQDPQQPSEQPRAPHSEEQAGSSQPQHHAQQEEPCREPTPAQTAEQLLSPPTNSEAEEGHEENRDQRLHPAPAAVANEEPSSMPEAPESPAEQEPPQMAAEVDLQPDAAPCAMPRPNGSVAHEEVAEDVPQRWQPFTAVEKVYSAYAWRRRRLAMLQAAASSAQPRSDESPN
eukprot:gb/GFBE01055137.1/.p1 GENE.gb/GFBE01055137.1/~~gb/GFBE01055137.1/.p1  ORF type:complete len:713 (+),score=132.39 gb/GFBE01055137.1/:1-2139(+)